MNISHLLNPVAPDQDRFSPPSPILDGGDGGGGGGGGRPSFHPSRKHSSSDSVEQLERLTFNDHPYSHDHSACDTKTHGHARFHTDTTLFTPYSQSDHAYNTHALRKTNQPPTPGEEPSCVHRLSPKCDPERSFDLEDRRKSLKRSSGSFGESSEPEQGNTSNNSSRSSSSSSSSTTSSVGSSSIKSPSQSSSPSEPSPIHGLSTEFPDQRQESSGDSSDATPTTPKFERNADGKFRCTWPRCGKEFAVESRLSTHYRIHSGKPPYPCGYPGCNKAFHTSSSLSHHRVVHTDQGLRPFVCRHNRCGATYTQLARLITHQRNTHSGMILFIQDASSSTSPPGPSSELVSNDIHAPALTTEPRALPAFVDSSLQPSDRPTELSIARSRPRVPRSHTSEPARMESGTDERDDLEQRQEAAMTIASLRELATVQDRHGYSSSHSAPLPLTRSPPSPPHPSPQHLSPQQYSLPYSPSQHQQHPQQYHPYHHHPSPSQHHHHAQEYHHPSHQHYNSSHQYRTDGIYHR
ncbi:MAG: hypothetical protein J3Q66DRAFT_320336 [Benniella sp.]|nr:MAG: hypothetical protein J3Q66DRAFT_320336 [Benniella sp.]